MHYENFDRSASAHAVRLGLFVVMKCTGAVSWCAHGAAHDKNGKNISPNLDEAKDISQLQGHGAQILGS
jgi:hypothetical protein